MRILLLGDYSNFHACLGKALALEGHDVVVASEGGGWMHTAADISTKRLLPSVAGGALLFARLRLDPRFRGFDVVSLISPSFVTLKPARLRSVFDMLRRYNGRVFLGAVGTDKAVMDYLTSPGCTLRYNEYMAYGHPVEQNKATLTADLAWTQGDIARWCEEVYSRCDGITTALYEYHLAMQAKVDDSHLCYTGIPIDISAVKPAGHAVAADGRVNFFLGRHAHRMAFKGTDRIEAAARRVEAEMPDKCKLTIVENLPYNKYVETMRSADVVLDQLYSYTPATNALLAMAAGHATLSGAEPEYYDFIGEKSTFPIFNAIPDDEALYATLRSMAENPEKVRLAAAQGREFVIRHNDSRLVARRHLDFWTRNFYET